MNTLIHADIFFFISTIWMIVISAILVFILWNVAKISNDAKHISKKLRQGSDMLSEDLNELRTMVHTKGETLKYVIKYFKHIFSRRQNNKK